MHDKMISDVVDAHMSVWKQAHPGYSGNEWMSEYFRVFQTLAISMWCDGSPELRDRAYDWLRRNHELYKPVAVAG